MRADGHSGLFEMQGRREVGISAAPASQKEKASQASGFLHACLFLSKCCIIFSISVLRNRHEVARSTSPRWPRCKLQGTETPQTPI